MSDALAWVGRGLGTGQPALAAAFACGCVPREPAASRRRCRCGTMLDRRSGGRDDLRVVRSAHRVLVGEGECFGEVAFFTEIAQIESVRSMTVVKLFCIPRAAYAQVAEVFPIGTRTVLENLSSRTEQVRARVHPSVRNLSVWKAIGLAVALPAWLCVHSVFPSVAVRPSVHRAA
jgi:CRP-like cAMP-binding protein